MNKVNSEVKGEGGTVGLTKNPAALRRWMVGGPEVARMIKEFEDSTPIPKYQHHEHQPHKPPLLEMSWTLSHHSKSDCVHTKDVVHETVVNVVQNVVKISEVPFNTFVNERFIDRSKPVIDTIKKNKLPTFNTSCKKVMTKEKEKIGLLKEDCAFFSRLYIACQSWDWNLEEFFLFENQPWPPSLSQMGQLREGQKAEAHVNGEKSRH